MDWSDLDAELKCWQAAGRLPDFWWRDDDAFEMTIALDRLLTLAADRPLALAVVPAGATQDLAQSCMKSVLQHGYTHHNHAGPGKRPVECGGDRPLSDILNELDQGAKRLVELFGQRFVPALVPPWNRVDAQVVPHLRELALQGLSGVGARNCRVAAEGVVQVNVHASVVSYRSGTGFAGKEKVLKQLVGHLKDRRSGTVDADEPTGLLTHHLDHDEPTWRFLDELLKRLDDAPVRWRGAAELFA